MPSFPTADYILKQYTSHMNKQKREEEIKVKREWYKIPKDCRDRLLKEIRQAMYNISKSTTISQMIDFTFELRGKGYSLTESKIENISEEMIHYFINSFNTRMYIRDKDNKDVKNYWHISLNTQNFKEFLKHYTSGKPLQLLLNIKPYKDKGLVNENNRK